MVTFSEVQMVSCLQLPLLLISSAAYIFLMVSFITLIFSNFKCHLACFCRGEKSSLCYVNDKRIFGYSFTASMKELIMQIEYECGRVGSYESRVGWKNDRKRTG